MTSLAAAPAPASLWSLRLAAPADGLLSRLSDWNDARVTRRMLSRLSVRQLDDIGLCRDDIAAVAAHPRR